MKELDPEQRLEVDRALRRFFTATLVGVWIGLVLFPLLFGGLSVGAWLVIPDPFGPGLGIGFAVCAVLGVLFMLWYRHRTLSRPPHALWATVGQGKVTVVKRHGVEERMASLPAQIHSEHEFSIQGIGPAKATVEVNRDLRATHESLLAVVPPGQAAWLFCVPTGELVAIWHHGLHVAGKRSTPGSAR